MSVINQMLKDLDKRQCQQQTAASVTVPVPTKSTTSKVILVIGTITIIIILNIAGLLGWQLYSENEQLKAQARPAVITLKNDQSAADTAENEVLFTAPVATVVPDSGPRLVADSTRTNQAVKRNEEAMPLSQAPAIITAKKSDKRLQNQAIEAVEVRKITARAAAEKASIVTSAAADVSINVIEKPEQLDKSEPMAPSLTISRSQLSPQALAAKKVSEAEQAIERNDLAKAEALFEEVLLVMPEHETARKQLAALWYGKKYYQDAVNLLSQGIALAPQAEEMRLMSARIYYEQAQPRQAYNILSPVKHSMSTELQALIANTAAELNEHEHAIVAYRKLIALEPNAARWWLGLGVSLDSLGDFVLARDAYKQALAENNLSSSAMQFARQRLQELGE